MARAKAALAGCLVELRRFDEADGLLGEAEATLAGQYGAADARVAGVRAQRARLGALRAAHVQ